MYRIPSDGGEPMQLTNLLTGVSGITALSPAMSAAGGRVIFSAYEEDGYNVYALDAEAASAGTAPSSCRSTRGAAAAHESRGHGRCDAAESDGVASARRRAAGRGALQAEVRLDFAGQPSIGVGADPFGTYATGGVSFLFSDVLGNHVLATSAQVTSRFDEFGGGVMYLNRVNRWNWGVALSQIPYVSATPQA